METGQRDMSTSNAFGKTICSICYEELNPILEDLQSISICGHVFHELCLQQWFEYCSNSKKCNCPVCKQSCSEKDAGRLYFQSVGDQSDSVISKVLDREEDSEVLRREVKRLEVKVSGLISHLESSEKELKGINQELSLCRDQIKKEVAQRDEALREKAAIQYLLQIKLEEFGQLTSECSRLKERNMALAKELAALKLVSDLEIGEDEVLKLASLGNDGNRKDTIDTLIKSLVIRNKTYKELMSKCNLLGRGEARSSEKLEKAKEKIEKLKKRVKELETVVEAKDNEVLRALKASKKCRQREFNESSPLSANFVSEDQLKQLFVTMNGLERTRSIADDKPDFQKRKDTIAINEIDLSHTKDPSTMVLNEKRNSLMVKNDPKDCTAFCEVQNTDLKDKFGKTFVQESSQPILDGVSEINGEATVQGLANVVCPLGSKIRAHSNKGNAPANPMDNSMMFKIRKESPSSVPVSKPGDICFSGGLQGPDGTNRYLGRWCKRGQSNGSVAVQGSVPSRSDLIAIGADGRGGRIKILRPSSQVPLDGKENIFAKRFKYVSRTSGLQSQGCLQIEHFFGKVNQ